MVKMKQTVCEGRHWNKLGKVYARVVLNLPAESNCVGCGCVGQV
jgi:hypothetical protein